MIRRLLGLMLAALMVTSSAGAKEIAGAKLPDSMAAGKDTLLLNGAGLRKKFRFVKVYAGGLYLIQRSSDPERIIQADEPMAVRMHFVYDVPSEKLIAAWNEGFDKATGGNTLPIKEEIEKFNDFFTEEAKKNDIYDIIYTPDQGVRVYMKGTLKGTVNGFDFKKALFGIWLGNEPADPGLKDGMLGK